MTSPAVRAALAPSALLAWALACSSPPPATVPAATGTFCAPGATQACLCAPQVNGIQVCRPDAKGWEPCQCGSGNSDAARTDAATDSTATTTADATAPDTPPASDSAAAAEIAADATPEPDLTDAEPDWAGLLDPPETDASDAADSLPKPDLPPAATDDCPERAKIVYVVTQQDMLLSFDPDAAALKPVGKLNCPAGFGSSPFSMGVDRQANAWVLYQTGFGAGSLWKVSTLDASCQATTFKPGQAGFELFGMGFSADAPLQKDESLWAAGGGALTFTMGQCSFGTIDTKTMLLKPVGKLQAGPGCPDLTGNGLAELFGFFTTSNPPSVARIDKATGQTLQSWPLPAAQFSGSTAAWAFAQWGGKLYLFFDNEATASTTISTLTPDTGVVATVKANIGHVVVGAGVSSCAPSKQAVP
jgi:hypothetical protein